MSSHLSIIVPAAEADEALNQHLERLASAPDADQLEVIVVAPGGAPEPQQARAFHRFTVLAGRDGSQPDAINIGAEAATGWALTWLNVDDALPAGAISRVLAERASAPETAVLYGRADQIRHPGGERIAYPVPRKVESQALFQRCCISQPAAWITAPAWRQLKGLRPRFDCAFDYDLWIRAAGAGVPFHHVDALLAEMDIRPSAKSYRKRAQVFREQAELQLLHFGRCPPSTLSAIWSEALWPAWDMADVSIDLLREGATTLRAIRAAAQRVEDNETVARIDGDFRLRLLQLGFAASVDQGGFMEGGGVFKVRSEMLPITILVRFETPIEGPNEAVFVAQPQGPALPSARFCGGHIMATSVSPDAAGDEEVASLAFITLSEQPAQIVGAWRT